VGAPPREGACGPAALLSSRCFSAARRRQRRQRPASARECRCNTVGASELTTDELCGRLSVAQKRKTPALVDPRHGLPAPSFTRLATWPALIVPFEMGDPRSARAKRNGRKVETRGFLQRRPPAGPGRDSPRRRTRLLENATAIQPRSVPEVGARHGERPWPRMPLCQPSISPRILSTSARWGGQHLRRGAPGFAVAASEYGRLLRSSNESRWVHGIGCPGKRLGAGMFAVR